MPGGYFTLNKHHNNPKHGTAWIMLHPFAPPHDPHCLSSGHTDPPAASNYNDGKFNLTCFDPSRLTLADCGVRKICYS
ncbi:hypothetical protein RRG08_039642 [Elysia crispata]|uniref:Uncharacterized protein n=1 Tax=Elysia crispata TaxID=231223 RepID=A0AAE0YBI8_9GAST|nr:hypothetical protein RRG08_039642 [Elysia crispata]